MGGESSGGGSSVDRSNPNEMRAREMAEATNRAKEEQERKSRQVAFDDYQQQRKAAAQGIDVMISPQKAKTVRENASLAMMLDERAKIRDKSSYTYYRYCCNGYDKHCKC